MYVCVYVYKCVRVYVYVSICVYVYMCTCVYVYMCICVQYMYRYIYIYVYPLKVKLPILATIDNIINNQGVVIGIFCDIDIMIHIYIHI